MFEIGKDQRIHLATQVVKFLDGAVIVSKSGEELTLRVSCRDDDDFLRIRFYPSGRDSSGQAALRLECRPPRMGEESQAVLHLSGWSMSPPGQGVGDAFMEKLSAFADQIGYPLYIKNVPTGATRQERDKFWRLHGFGDCSGGNCIDYWRPVGVFPDV